MRFRLRMLCMTCMLMLLWVLPVEAKEGKTLSEPVGADLSLYRGIKGKLTDPFPKTEANHVRFRGMKATVYFKPLEHADGYLILRKERKGEWQEIARLSKEDCKEALASPKGKRKQAYGYSYEDRDPALQKGTYYYSVQAYKKVGKNTILSDFDDCKAVSFTGFDLQTNYPDVSYTNAYGYPEGATVSSGGCGPAVIGNILRNQLGIEEADTLTMCELAKECGARYNGGTDVAWLFKNAVKKWGGFSYRYMESTSGMLSYVKEGCMALAHTYGYYPLFADNGHFVSVIDCDENDKVTIFDSYMPTDRKWILNSVRLNNIDVTDEIGKVYTSYPALTKACDYYYLVEPMTNGISDVTEVKKAATGMKVSFSDVTGCQDYHIYRKGEKDKDFIFVGIGDKNKGYYIDDTAKNGKTYTYKVLSGSGPMVNEAFGKSKSGLFISAPVITDATLTEDGQISLKWKDKALFYEICVSRHADFSKSKKYKVYDENARSYTIGDRDPSKKWYVSVRSKKEVDGKQYYSAWSDAYELEPVVKEKKDQ